MQIVCPNCTTAYEIPDAVFGGRARKLRCENCGTQWRAGPPDTEEGAGAEEAAAVAAPPPPPPSTPGRVFGKPADASVQAEIRQAMDRERHTPAPPAGAPADTPADTSVDAEDPFINLVLAARSRAIEFEPEAPAEPRFTLSGPILIGTLLVLFVAAVSFLLLHAR